MDGIVIKTVGGFYSVRTDANEVIQCSLKGKFRIEGIKSTNPIVVGDKVELQKVSGFWMITELYERKNQILRSHYSNYFF